MEHDGEYDVSWSMHKMVMSWRRHFQCALHQSLCMQQDAKYSPWQAEEVEVETNKPEKAARAPFEAIFVPASCSRACTNRSEHAQMGQAFARPWITVHLAIMSQRPLHLMNLHCYTCLVFHVQVPLSKTNSIFWHLLLQADKCSRWNKLTHYSRNHRGMLQLPEIHGTFKYLQIVT